MTEKDFSICEQVPIKHLGFLQSYTYCFIFKLDDKTMLGWSDNVKDLSLKNFPFHAFFPSSDRIGKPIHSIQIDTVQTKIDNQDFYIHSSQNQNHFFLELEALQDKFLNEASAITKKQKIETLNQTFIVSDEEVWLQNILSELTDLIKPDRALIYKFDSDYSGQVICEHIQDQSLESFLDLRFPATDIPKIVRDLYLHNPTRFIFDCLENGCKLQADADVGIHPESIDLTSLHGRGVSYFHTDYMKAMGIRTSFSIALTHGDMLWGLINFQFIRPRHLDFSLRSFAAEVGKSISQMLTLRSASMLMKITDSLKLQLQEKILSLTRLNQDHFMENIYKFFAIQLNLVGMAIKIQDDSWICKGVTPAPLDSFKTWVDSLSEKTTHFSTRSIKSQIKESDMVPFSYEKIAGVLFSKVFHNGKCISIYLFRPPLPETVRWAGKAIAPKTETYAPSPKRSFAIWTESRQFHSADWTFIDRKYTWEIGKVILEHIKFL